jgi:branched-chain amino acid transport system permease protein
MDYLLHILIMIGIYSIVAMSLNLLAGYTGLISVAHAAFYGIGAYTTALLALKVGLPFWTIFLPEHLPPELWHFLLHGLH